MSKLAPQRFGKYILLRRLAVGGMAEIFKAKIAGAEGFERDLVIKRILPHFSDDEQFVQMFVDEASITSKLTHPNIIQIFDFDVVDGAYYIAMEYIEGKDLKDVLEVAIKQRDALSVPQAVWIATEIAKGLQYAHTKQDKGQPLNIVHRDVTPSNVMVSFRGDVKLMDFGIAKAAQRSTKTQAGAVKGKVAYMAPEQARGKPIDGRTDVFALGVVLWEMLTNARLFLAESDFDTLNNVLKMEAPAPSSLNKAVPKDLDPIVLKALTKDVSQRWASAEAFGRELTRWYFSNVTDIEKEKLKPLMYRLFKKEIEAVQKAADEDETMLGGGGTVRGSSAAQARPSLNAESTAMHAARGDDDAHDSDDTDDDQPSERHTRVRPFADETTKAHRRVHGESTSARMEAGTTMTAAVEATDPGFKPAKKKKPGAAGASSSRRSPWLWIILLLLVGGGVAAALVVLGGGGSGTSGTDTREATATGDGDKADATAAPTKKTATLYIKVDPHTATVTVDGKPTEGEVRGLELGQKVRIVAEESGYKRFEEIVGIDEESPVYPIKMVKDGIPHRIVIKPTGEADEVFVDDNRLGTGAQPFEGMLGQEITIRVVPATGEPVAKKVVLEAAMGVVTVAQPAKLVLAVDPADAVVTSSIGKVEVKEAGQVVISDLQVGDDVAIEVKAQGFKVLKQEIKITGTLQPLGVKLEKGSGGGGTVSGKGSIVVAAKPSAQVTVNGKLYGTTPQQIKDLPAGRYVVVLTRGDRTVTKNVSVAAGKQADVFVDFTN